MQRTLTTRKPAQDLARRRACLRFGVRPNAFGNALGGALVDSMQSRNSAQQNFRASEIQASNAADAAAQAQSAMSAAQSGFRSSEIGLQNSDAALLAAQDANPHDLGGPDEADGVLNNAMKVGKAIIGTAKAMGSITPRDIVNYWTGTVSGSSQSANSPNSTSSAADRSAFYKSDRYYYSSVGNTADSSIDDRIGYSYANGVLPNVEGLTAAQKGSLYGQMFLDTNNIFKYDVLPEVKANAADAISAYNNGDAVMFGMRMETSLDVNNGRGSFDDRLVALQKQNDGSINLLFEGMYTADPAGRYQQGNPYAGSHLEGTHANPVSPQELDIGRLRAGTYPYKFSLSDANKGEAFFSDSTDNVLRPTQNVPADRYFNDRWNFDADSFKGDSLNSPFSAKNSVLFHTSYASSASPTGYFTGSAACQTLPTTGTGTIRSLANLLNLGQSKVFYTLTNVGVANNGH
jgi:hypothetical protein